MIVILPSWARLTWASVIEAPPSTHTGDQDGNGVISLNELLRVIQFFNTGGYHCAATPTEDGYGPAPGADHSCAPHASDYHPDGPDWAISLTELLRLIQFFNTGGYYPCPADGTEDGYCRGGTGR